MVVASMNASSIPHGTVTILVMAKARNDHFARARGGGGEARGC
jgi:hypothetical protein